MTKRVQNFRCFTGYSLVILPKIKGLRILNFSKGITLVSGKNQGVKKFQLFKGCHLGFFPKITGIDFPILERVSIALVFGQIMKGFRIPDFP